MGALRPNIASGSSPLCFINSDSNSGFLAHDGIIYFGSSSCSSSSPSFLLPTVLVLFTDFFELTLDDDGVGIFLRVLVTDGVFDYQLTLHELA